MKKKIIKRLFFAGGLSAALCIGSMMAYFTDTDAAGNTFTVGKISLDLQEPNWDPGNGQGLTPGKEVRKDPQVLNDGSNDEYVFLEVSVPYEHIITANEDGTKNEADDVQLWQFSVNEGWMQLGQVRKDSQEKRNIYLYAYAKDQVCTRLAKDAVTPALFNSVKFVNAVEGQGLEEAVKNIDITAYGIQADNIRDGKAVPEEVWSVLKNQSL